MALAKWFPAGSGVKVIAEPGTFYVASASTLAVAVIGKKVVKRKYSTENGENMHFFHQHSNTIPSVIALNQNVIKI